MEYISIIARTYAVFLISALIAQWNDTSIPVFIFWGLFGAAMWFVLFDWPWTHKNSKKQ